MFNPYYSTDRSLRVGFKINSVNHHINHANSKLTLIPNFSEIGIEVRYINKIVKDLSIIYARLINQYKFKYQTVFSARFDKQDENDQVLDETELFSNLKINHKLTESDLDKNDIKSPLEHQIQKQELKDSGWRFDEINSITKCFHKLVKWMVQIMLKILWDQRLSWLLETMINIVSYGQYQPICILVIEIIPIQVKIINNVSMN